MPPIHLAKGQHDESTSTKHAGDIVILLQIDCTLSLSNIHEFYVGLNAEYSLTALKIV